MRYAVVAKYKKLCAEFGQCTEFAIMDVEDNVITTENFWSSPPHEFGNLPEWLRHEMKVDVVIAGRIDPKNSRIMTALGMTVLSGSVNDNPRALVEACLRGRTATGASVCEL